MLRTVLRLLFGQMDRAAFDAATDQVLELVTGRPLVNAVKEVSFVVEACVFASPAAALCRLFVPLTDGILAGGVSECPVLGGLSNRELAWRLRLLAGACRYGGAELLPFGPTLKAILSETCVHRDGDVAKSSGKLLRAVLHGLAETYPTDYRSCPRDSEWNWPKYLGRGPAAEVRTVWPPLGVRPRPADAGSSLTGPGRGGVAPVRRGGAGNGGGLAREPPLCPA